MTENSSYWSYFDGYLATEHFPDISSFSLFFFSGCLWVSSCNRSLLEQANIKDPRVHIPALFIVGDKDYFLKFPGVKDYISGGLKSLVPNLQMANLPEGTHFVQEQLPDEVNQLVLDFLTRNSQSWKSSIRLCPKAFNSSVVASIRMCEWVTPSVMFYQVLVVFYI